MAIRARTASSRPFCDRKAPPKLFRSVRSCHRISRQALHVNNSATVKDSASGVDYLLAQKFWEGEDMRCLGAGTRSKKVVLFNVKVYSIALYIEAVRAAKELGIRYRGGFFENDEDYCQALLDGAFNKVLLVHLVRDIEGSQFAAAISEALVPRMRLAGEMDILTKFTEFFNSKKLSANMEVVLFWNLAGDLEVVTREGVTAPVDYLDCKPEFRVRSPGLCRGLYEIYLGSQGVIPEAKTAWVAGAKNLLDYDKVKRDTRKGGSG